MFDSSRQVVTTDFAKVSQSARSDSFATEGPQNKQGLLPRPQ